MDDELRITDETTMPVDMPTVQGLRRADIVFVVDCTRTMDVTLLAIVETIDEVARMYHEADVKIRMGVTEFRDLTWPGDETKYERHLLYHHEFGESKLTDNLELFRASLGKLEALGGGKLRESCYEALVSTIENVDWGEGADKVIVFFSDAEPWIPPVGKYTIEETSSKLEDGKLDQLHLVIDKKKWEEAYYELLLIPSPSNSNDQIHGDSWDLFREGRGLAGEDKERVADLDELKGILGKIARVSITGLRNSNPNNKFFQGRTKKRNTKKRNDEKKNVKSSNRYL